MSPLQRYAFSFSSLLTRSSPYISPPCIPRRLLSIDTLNRLPLQILFCGSDHFSATSLKALYGLYTKQRDVISSIDVLCKTNKPSGRGLKMLNETPLKDVANSLSLPVHELRNFKDWNLLEASNGGEINLIVAVSFGELIPSEIIAKAKYGGINVHPSLLPMYRGPAPIYHTLLNNTPITGVTVQTLHPQKFDHGTLLLQTNPPFNVPPQTSYQDLHDSLAVHGAELLVETCVKGLFVPPVKPVTNNYKPSIALKIDPDTHAKIRFTELSAEDIERNAGALGSLWCKFGSPEEPQLLKRVRAILSNISKLDVPEENIDGIEVPPGTFEYLRMEKGGGRSGDELLAIKCRVGGGWIRVGGIKLEGKKLVDGGEWARSMSDSNKKSTLKMFM